MWKIKERRRKYTSLIYLEDQGTSRPNSVKSCWSPSSLRASVPPVKPFNSQRGRGRSGERRNNNQFKTQPQARWGLEINVNISFPSVGLKGWLWGNFQLWGKFCRRGHFFLMSLFVKPQAAEPRREERSEGVWRPLQHWPETARPPQTVRHLQTHPSFLSVWPGHTHYIASPGLILMSRMPFAYRKPERENIQMRCQRQVLNYNNLNFYETM